MGVFVYIVVREDDLNIASKHMCFTDKTEAYRYALVKAHQEPTNSNYEWKVIHVEVYEAD
jgi:hypothetical protein